MSRDEQERLRDIQDAITAIRNHLCRAPRAQLRHLQTFLPLGGANVCYYRQRHPAGGGDGRRGEQPRCQAVCQSQLLLQKPPRPRAATAHVHEMSFIRLELTSRNPVGDRQPLSGESGIAVLAPRPAAGPALAILQLLLCPANAAFSGRLLLGILDPADELVARQGRDVLPGIECRGVGHQRLAQVRR